MGKLDLRRLDIGRQGICKLDMKKLEMKKLGRNKCAEALQSLGGADKLSRAAQLYRRRVSENAG